MMEDRRGESTSEFFSQYQTLQQKIQNWEPPTSRYLDTSPEKTNTLIIAARIYQKGLLIFLHSSFYISNAKDPILIAEVDSIADEMFLLLEEISTRAASTILWPMIIMGSCLRLLEKRHKLREMLVASPFHMTAVPRTIQLLDWLWEDPSAHGPHGLEAVMKKHKINLCMA
jgi:hypothetical protein